MIFVVKIRFSFYIWVLAGLFYFCIMKKTLIFLFFLTLSACQNSTNVLKQTPLYVVDGTIVQTIDSILPDDIASIYVLKGEKAIQAYGRKGKHGVIEITLK